MRVPDEPAQLHRKAEACRLLAEMYEEDPARQALWIERADHWEKLAIKADELPRQRS